MRIVCPDSLLGGLRPDPSVICRPEPCDNATPLCRRRVVPPCQVRDRIDRPDVPQGVSAPVQHIAGAIQFFTARRGMAPRPSAPPADEALQDTTSKQTSLDPSQDGKFKSLQDPGWFSAEYLARFAAEL